MGKERASYMASVSRYGPYKKGDRHPDGRIFLRYDRGKACWVSEEVFKHKMKVRQDYYRLAMAEYCKKEHPPLYTCKEGLYFVGNSHGKERWVTYNVYLSIRRGREIKRKAHYLRNKRKTKDCYKTGQQHPENPELYFAGYSYGKPRWLSYEAYQKRQEMVRKSNYKGMTKLRIRKAKILTLIKDKIKRGTEKEGLRFWDYGSHGNEIWIDPELYEQRMEAMRQKSKRHYYKKKNMQENPL